MERERKKKRQWRSGGKESVVDEQRRTGGRVEMKLGEGIRKKKRCKR